MNEEITIQRAPGGRFELRSEQWVPAQVGEVFAFFSEAPNLELLTPRFLNFRILTPAPLIMREGLLIDYRIRLHGFPLRWRSEITCWEPPGRFVDEQVKGPYRVWRHEHAFEAREGGTVARDHVVYAVWGGAPVNRLFVEPDVRRIFAFRRDRMGDLFGGRSPSKDVTVDADTAGRGESSASTGSAA